MKVTIQDKSYLVKLTVAEVMQGIEIPTPDSPVSNIVLIFPSKRKLLAKSTIMLKNAKKMVSGFITIMGDSFLTLEHSKVDFITRTIPEYRIYGICDGSIELTDSTAAELIGL